MERYSRRCGAQRRRECVFGGALEKTVKGGRMEGDRKRQPTLFLPEGFSGLLMFTSRISIKMGEECLCVWLEIKKKGREYLGTCV